MKVVQKTDLYVGIFVILVIGAVVAALVATSGWGIKRSKLVMRTNDASDLRVDTKIYLQGLEIGRITAIEPHPAGSRGDSLEFTIRAEILAQYPDGTPLLLRKGTDAELEKELLGGSTLLLDVHGDTAAYLGPNAVLELHHRTPAMQQLGSLAGDLRGKIGTALDATTLTLASFRHLADSLTLATGTARHFVAGIEPGTTRALDEAATSMQHVRGLLDSTNGRSALTMQQLNATMEQSRKLMASADSLTRLLTTMGAENRPAIREVLENSRFLSQQTLYLMEALSRRPMRIMSGVDLPESLTVKGRAQRDSARAAHADSIRAARDTTHTPRRP